jgi:hypothetical protein
MAANSRVFGDNSQEIKVLRRFSERSRGRAARRVRRLAGRNSLLSNPPRADYDASQCAWLKLENSSEPDRLPREILRA